LVQAQRVYAEKLSFPSSSDGRFTQEQLDGMVDKLSLEDWAAAFIQQDEGTWLMKENQPERSHNKGKHRPR
jgi:hypothetical protein